jgi:hypothetical protein
LAVVSPIAVRRFLTASRRRLALLLALLALCGVVEAHHGVPMDMHAMSAGVVCLAVAAAAIAVVAAVVGLLVAAWLRPVSWALTRVRPLAPRSVPARAGPALFLRLGVLRR